MAAVVAAEQWLHHVNSGSWHSSSRGTWGKTRVGWVMQGWGGVGHAGVGHAGLDGVNLDMPQGIKSDRIIIEVQGVESLTPKY